MTSDTIRRLSQLNADFYAQIAEDFDSTRQEYWPGWEQLVPHLHPLTQPEPLKVLDVGCGNGRFGLFLADHFRASLLNYTGIDQSPQLLKKAEARLKPRLAQTTFKAQDIVDLAMTKQLSPMVGEERYGLSTLLGVLHHIPAFEVRLSLLQQLAQLLQPGGLLVVTIWQFMEFERLRRKVVPPVQVGFAPAELERNDYFLDWERGQVAYRYCHFVDDSERKKLVTGLQSTCQLIDTYRADGKEGNMDLYLVFQRS